MTRHVLPPLILHPFTDAASSIQVLESAKAAALMIGYGEEYSGQRVGGPGGPDVGAVRYGRIPGAKHLYFEELLDGSKAFRPVSELEQLVMARGAAPQRDIITYCRMSHRATVLYFALTQLLGFKKVKVYDGSWTEWGNLVGVPVER